MYAIIYLLTNLLTYLLKFHKNGITYFNDYGSTTTKIPLALKFVNLKLTHAGSWLVNT